MDLRRKIALWICPELSVQTKSSPVVVCVPNPVNTRMAEFIKAKYEFGSLDDGQDYTDFKAQLKEYCVNRNNHLFTVSYICAWQVAISNGWRVLDVDEALAWLKEELTGPAPTKKKVA